MGLDKAIKYKKEKRKEYKRSKQFDTSCRNHGSCPYCKNNRLKKDIEKAKEFDKEIKLKESYEE